MRDQGMMGLILGVFILSFFAAGTTVMLLRIHQQKLPQGALNEIDFRKKECDRMWYTAEKEEEVYGVVVSGSVANHIVDCNHCIWVRTGDAKALKAHQQDTKQIIEEWNSGRRGTSNST